MRHLFVALLALCVFASFSTNASADAPSTNVPAPVVIAAPQRAPDLFSFGAADYDFDKSERKTHSSDYRFEYRSGYRFLGNEEFSFQPFAGFEMTSRDLLYGLGGFNMDWNFSQHYVATWSEGVGYLDSGKQRSLGGTLQFRSMAEFGYRFDNEMRLTAEFSHISDAKLTRVNPGAEIGGFYIHTPIRMIVGALAQ